MSNPYLDFGLKHKSRGLKVPRQRLYTREGFLYLCIISWSRRQLVSREVVQIQTDNCVSQRIHNFRNRFDHFLPKFELWLKLFQLSSGQTCSNIMLFDDPFFKCTFKIFTNFNKLIINNLLWRQLRKSIILRAKIYWSFIIFFLFSNQVFIIFVQTNKNWWFFTLIISQIWWI